MLAGGNCGPTDRDYQASIEQIGAGGWKLDGVSKNHI